MPSGSLLFLAFPTPTTHRLDEFIDTLAFGPNVLAFVHEGVEVLDGTHPLLGGEFLQTCFLW
jgi:hypothetical protein